MGKVETKMLQKKKKKPVRYISWLSLSGTWTHQKFILYLALKGLFIYEQQ